MLTSCNKCQSPLSRSCPNREDSYLTQLVPVSASTDVTYPSHYRRFFFKMFTFVSQVANDPSQKANAEPQSMTPLKEMVNDHLIWKRKHVCHFKNFITNLQMMNCALYQVFIHCDTAVCQPSLGNNCEPICLRKSE